MEHILNTTHQPSQARSFTAVEAGETDKIKATTFDEKTVDPVLRNQLMNSFREDLIPKILSSTGVSSGFTFMEKNDFTGLLKRAMYYNDHEMVKFFLDNKHSGEHPLVRAVENQSLLIVKRLWHIYGVAIEGGLKREDTPLMIAIKNGLLDIVKSLLDGGASITGVGVEKYSDIPLVMAVRCGYGDIVCTLLERGAFHQLIENEDSLYCIPEHLLSIAVDNEDLDMIKLLEKLGILNIASLCNEFKFKDNKGIPTNALMRAARTGNSDVFYYLVERGASLYTVDQRGHSLLTYALKSKIRNESIIIFLLKKGIMYVEQQLSNESGNILPPIALAIKEGWGGKIIEVLLKYGADVNAGGDIFVFAKNGMKSVLHKTVSVFDYRMNPIQMATYYGNESAVRILLKYGVKIDDPITSKRHPVFIAVKNGRVGVFNLLLDCDRLKINLDEIGNRLMELAKVYGHLEIIYELRRRGVKEHPDRVI